MVQSNSIDSSLRWVVGLNVAVPSLPAEGPYTKRETHERQRVWPSRFRLSEAGGQRTVSRFHTPPDSVGRRVRGVRRLGDDAHGVRASHRERVGRAHGLRLRAVKTDRTGVERGWRRISLAGRRGKPSGIAEGKPNNPR